MRLGDGDHIKIVEYELIFHQADPVVHEPQRDSTTVLGSLHDLSSDYLVNAPNTLPGRSRPSSTWSAHWAAEPIWAKCSAGPSTA